MHVLVLQAMLAPHGSTGRHRIRLMDHQPAATFFFSAACLIPPLSSWVALAPLVPVARRDHQHDPAAAARRASCWLVVVLSFFFLRLLVRCIVAVYPATARRFGKKRRQPSSHSQHCTPRRCSTAPQVRPASSRLVSSVPRLFLLGGFLPPFVS